MEKTQISVEEIMEKIKEEIQRRKAQQKQKTAPTINPLVEKTYIDPIKLTLPEQRIKIKDSYNIKELLTFHDAEFIKNAYRAILKREPDPEGYEHYLNNLRVGNLSKTEILARLRYSPEGKKKRVNIKGLFRHLTLNYLKKAPLINYIFRSSIKKQLEIHLQIQQQLLLNAENKINKTIEQVNKKINFVNLLQNELEKKQEEINRTLEAKIKEINRQIRDHKLNIIDQQRRIASLLEKSYKILPESISQEQTKNIHAKENHILDAMYVSFEDCFRGSRENIKKRFKIYLPYVKEIFDKIGNGLVLDIGCGRGEWLELLKENNFEAIGIDINRIMVDQCKELNLNVIEKDVLEYLKNQENESLNVVTAFHIVEHLPFKTMIILLDECFRILKSGGMIIVETPNPENILVGACSFYIDPTHRNPIPPETLKFLIKERGFVNEKIKRLHKRKQPSYTDNEDINEILNRINMERDYAIIAYKS